VPLTTLLKKITSTRQYLPVLLCCLSLAACGSGSTAVGTTPAAPVLAPTPTPTPTPGPLTLPVVNSAPTASTVTVTDPNGGSAVVGDTLAGSYTYSDTDGDVEGVSTFRWLRNGVAISGAVAASYALVTADTGTSITFEVTPVAATGVKTGQATISPSGVIVTNVTNKITQFGITWTFSQNLVYGQTYGQFINGDYWVLGPVTITSVSPGWDGIRNGSVLDMGSAARQGFYDGTTNGGIWQYDPTLRSTFPLVVPGGAIHSLISTIGKAVPSAGGAQQALSTAAILTIVTTPPPADAFRPAYMGVKTIHRWSSARTNLLPNLPVPSGATLPATTSIERPWLHNVPNAGLDVGSIGAMIHPDQNMPPYPRDSAYVVSDYAAAVILNSPKRDVYAKQLIQLGIDLYGVHKTARQDAFMGDGGYGSGWKFPILFAGLMLNDVGMLAPRKLINNLYGGVVDSFGEDGQTYMSLAYVPSRPMWGADGVGIGYLQPYWPNADFRDPAGIAEVSPPPGFPSVSWGGGYRLCCTSPTWVGEALAVKALGLQSAWGHNAWFAYVDRWVSDNYTGGIANLYGDNFVKSVWTAYRASYP